MTDSISPSNITGAALFAQFIIMVIMIVAAFMLHKGEESTPSSLRGPSFSGLVWKIVAVALLPIGCLLFSDEFSKLWRPLLQDSSVPTLPLRWALIVMFLSDILLVTILVILTGGSKDSPFGPLYFLLPTLAILLREPPGRLLLYVSLTIVSFSLVLYIHLDVEHVKKRFIQDDKLSKHTVAYLIVSIACFILATFIGYVTRIK